MRQITIDFDKMTVSGLVDNKYAGYLGEHNATELVVTKPISLDGAKFSVAFMTNGEVVHSKFFDNSETIALPLWQQLTQDNTLYVQLEAYDENGDYLGKSNVAKLNLGNSVHGVDVIADADNPDIYAEISLNTAFRETLEDNVDTLDKLSTSETGKLLFNGNLIEGNGSDSGSGLTEEQAADLAANTEARHTHENKSVLDKFGVNFNGSYPTFKKNSLTAAKQLTFLEDVVDRDNSLLRAIPAKAVVEGSKVIFKNGVGTGTEIFSFELPESYTPEEIDEMISRIPKLSIKVVDALPTENIDESTLYLVGGVENAIPESVDADGNVFNGTGYRQNAKWSESLGEDVSADGVCITGYIPVNSGDVIRLKNISISSADTTNPCILFYTNDFYSTYRSHYANDLVGLVPIWEDNLLVGFKVPQTTTTIKYLRIQANEIDENSAISINQEEGNLYTEYIYVNGEWERLGGQRLDLTGNVDLSNYYTKTETDETFAKKTDTPTKTSELENDSGFITADDIPDTPVISDEQIAEAVNDYLIENPVGSEDFVLKEEFNNPHKYPNAEPTANLINLDNLAYGYYVSETSGNLIANNSYRVTEFIPVKPSTNYVGKSTTMRYAWYDKDKVFISGAKKVLNEVSPENATYLRMTLNSANMPDFMIVEGTAYPQKFIPYKTKLPWLTPELPEMKAYDFAVDGAYQLANIFNKHTAESGYYLDNSGIKVAYDNHTASDFIPCKAETVYSINDYTMRYAFYDESYRFISGGRLTNTERQFTSPTGAVFMRVSILTSKIDTLTVVEGEEIPTGYIPYGVVAPWLHTETKISKYHGKKMVCFGDSITYGGYNTVITEDTGIETVNAGFSSARYAYKASVNEKNYFSLHNIVDAICTGDWTIPNQIIGVEGYTGQASQVEKLKTIDFNTVDFVSFAYGTNDFGSGTPYADSDNLYDVNTVSGAVRYAIKTLLTSYPHIRIIVALPIYRFFSTDGVIIEDSSTKDFGGGILPEYCEAIKKAAQDMHIPVVDLYKNGGINEFNRLNYFGIDDGTHPNGKGSAVIGHGIAEGVLRYL